MGTAFFLNKSSASYFMVYIPGSSLKTSPEMTTPGVIEAVVVIVAPRSMYGEPKSKRI